MPPDDDLSACMRPQRVVHQPQVLTFNLKSFWKNWLWRAEKKSATAVLTERDLLKDTSSNGSGGCLRSKAWNMARRRPLKLIPLVNGIASPTPPKLIALQAHKVSPKMRMVQGSNWPGGWSLTMIVKISLPWVWPTWPNLKQKIQLRVTAVGMCLWTCCLVCSCVFSWGIPGAWGSYPQAIPVIGEACKSGTSPAKSWYIIMSKWECCLPPRNIPQPLCFWKARPTSLTWGALLKCLTIQHWSSSISVLSTWTPFRSESRRGATHWHRHWWSHMAEKGLGIKFSPGIYSSASPWNSILENRTWKRH